jgi:hypothetical protein
MSSLDLVPGEQIIFQVSLRKDKWKCYRCLMCSCRLLSSIYGAICVPIYYMLGTYCRQKEADSFELILTNQNLHYRQMFYQCGCCCQKSETKIIPLEKIQDISLVSDCCGDCCNIVDRPGDVYKLHVQTAAMGGMIPELSVFCIENPREFKQKVLAAKNRVVTDTNIVGQSKVIDVSQILTSVDNKEDITRIINLLESSLHDNNSS